MPIMNTSNPSIIDKGNDKKTCVNCIWYCLEDITFGHVCVNDQSTHCADWVEEDDYCPHFETK